MKNNCRICGLYIKNKPWGDDNETPSYEICACCGVEFGNEDYTVESIKTYRLNWLTKGAIWFEPNEKHKEWNLEKQLENIPKEYK